MRVKKHSVEIRHHGALFCDPLVVGCDPSRSLNDGACFRLWEGNGEFNVYTDGGCFFVDVEPRILRAKSRPQLAKVPGYVGVDTAHVGIFDLTPDRVAAADDAIADGWAVVINDLRLGQYVAWFEEKGSETELFRGVVGFGRHFRMLLNGDLAEQLQSLEDRIASALRKKGGERQTEIKSIGDALLQMHVDGCKDRRLRMLAGAIKLELPRRPTRNS